MAALGFILLFPTVFLAYREWQWNAVPSPEPRFPGEPSLLDVVPLKWRMGTIILILLLTVTAVAFLPIPSLDSQSKDSNLYLWMLKNNPYLLLEEEVLFLLAFGTVLFTIKGLTFDQIGLGKERLTAVKPGPALVTTLGMAGAVLAAWILLDGAGDFVAQWLPPTDKTNSDTLKELAKIIPQWAVFLTVVVLSPFTEELLFRGLIFPLTIHWAGLKRGMFWTAMLQAFPSMIAVTSAPAMMFKVFLASYASCWLYERTRFLGFPMLLNLLISAAIFAEIV